MTSKRLSAFAFQISSLPSSLRMRIMIGDVRGMSFFCISARMLEGSGCSTLFLTDFRSMLAESSVSLQPVRAVATRRAKAMCFRRIDTDHIDLERRTNSVQDFDNKAVIFTYS